jgi:hypothetical protein
VCTVGVMAEGLAGERAATLLTTKAPGGRLCIADKGMGV